MIHENRIYAVISVVALVLITVFYLLYLGRYSKENVIYIQGNSRYTLPISSTYKNINVFDTKTLTYDINISRIYLDTFDGHTRTGRFILHFSQAGSVNFRAVDNNGTVVSNFKEQAIRVNYPLYVDFHVDKGVQYVDLQYSTNVNTVVLYKLSVEFF